MLGTQYTTPDDIIAEATSLVDDEEMRVRSRGYYLSLIRDALQEMAFDSMFDTRVFTAAIPPELIIDIPEGLAGIRNAYLYNGPVCAVETAQNVYWHRNMVRHDSGNYFANNREGMRDRIMETSVPFQQTNLYYFNVQNGKLMLSSSCAQFESFYLEYSGLGSDIGKEPVIPEYIKSAIVDYVVYNTLAFRMARDPNRWAALYDRAERRLYGGNRPQMGSWHQAMVRVNSIDPKQRDDMSKYLSRFGYPGR